jgi:AraC-like DNA-binding protein
MRAKSALATAFSWELELTSGIHDSPMGYWQFVRGHTPGFAHLVEDIWYFDGMATSARERSLPNGQLHIIVHFDQRYRDVHEQETVVCPQICMAGVQTRPLIVEAPGGRNALMGIRLHPAGAYSLLAHPLADTSGLTVDLHDVIGRAAAQLGERCADVHSPEARVRRAAEWVSERLDAGVRVDPALAWVTAQIEQSRGRRRIDDLRLAAGFTKRRLLDAFRTQIGVTPKVYARIVRLRHTLARLHAGDSPLADVAIAAGYYDQPHMNAEFRELCGMAPSEFLATPRYSATSTVVGK